MRLNECFLRTPLTEAIRFDSEAMSILKQHENLFRVGIELEFHIDEEVSGHNVYMSRDELLDDPDTRDVIDGEVDSKLRNDFIDNLASFLDEADVHPSSIDELEGIADDALNGDTDEYDDFVQWLSNTATVQRIDELTKSTYLPVFYPDFHSDLRSLRGLAMGLRRNPSPSTLKTFTQMSSLTDYEELINTLDSPSRVMYINNIMSDIETDDVYVDVRSEIAEPTLSRLERQPVADLDREEQLVALVSDMLDDSSISDMIENVETDSSVVNGVEVISLPLTLGMSNRFITEMFRFIKANGSTSAATGMHVNISMANEKLMNSVDPLRVITLADTDFFQNATAADPQINKVIDKYEERNKFVARNTSVLTSYMLESIAEKYVTGGVDGLEEAARWALVEQNVARRKYYGTNFMHLLGNMYNQAHKRIEFRFFGQSGGGNGYENRGDEIIKDINFLCYTILMSTNVNSPKVRQAHLKSLIRILDRASRTTMGKSFSQVIEMKRGITNESKEDKPMSFEALLESEIDLLESSRKRAYSGSVDAFSERNEYEAIPTPDGGYIISVSNSGGHEGVVEIDGPGVVYKDDRGNIVHREKRSPRVDRNSINNHFIPTLLGRTRTEDMF